MMGKFIQNIPSHFVEIPNLDWVQEIIEEKFDNAVGLMVKGSAVYGGAVRDAVAGKELLGDLDIATDSMGAMQMKKYFSEDPRWKSDNQQKTIMKARPYIKSGLSKIENLQSFTGMAGQKAQIIVSNVHNKSWIQTVLALSQTVDIICCALIMDINGRVYETLPRAFEQCKKGVLTLNPYVEIKDINILANRVNKLVERGWKSEIDFGKVVKKMKKQEKKQASKKLSQFEEIMEKRLSTEVLVTLTTSNEPGKLDGLMKFVKSCFHDLEVSLNTKMNVYTNAGDDYGDLKIDFNVREAIALTLEKRLCKFVKKVEISPIQEKHLVSEALSYEKNPEGRPFTFDKRNLWYLRQ
jgi:hypothetical protein